MANDYLLFLFPLRERSDLKKSCRIKQVTTKDILYIRHKDKPIVPTQKIHQGADKKLEGATRKIII